MPDTSEIKTASPPPPTLSGVVAALAEHVELLCEEGAPPVDFDRASLRELAAPPPAPPRPAPGSAMVEPRSAADRLAAIAAEIAVCTKCPLHRSRSKTVPGEGNPQPEIVFVGEGPGAEEDRQGRPFVGPAGALLTRMIVAMGLTREQVFIANVVKCRATETYAMIKDRPPTPEEMRACLPYLRAQIAALRPRVIVTLGNAAIEGLLGLKGITRLRGQWQSFDGIPLMPTYHPSYLLRGGGDETARYWEVWEDLVVVLRRLGREPPPRERKRKGA